MKAIVISAGKIDQDFNQTVNFKIVHGDNDEVLLTHSIKAHVDAIRAEIETFTREWGIKYLQSQAVQDGDTIEVE